jgi:hypothetical protein
MEKEEEQELKNKMGEEQLCYTKKTNPLTIHPHWKKITLSYFFIIFSKGGG